MNELPSIKPTPEHIIQPHSRFTRQDGWRLDDVSLCSSVNIAVSGHKYQSLSAFIVSSNNYRTEQSSFVCVYSTIDNSDSRDKPTLLYEKQFEDKDSGWPPWRRISFLEPNSTEIVTCRYDEVQVIDYNRDVVLRSRKVNGKTRCLSVNKSQIFIGLNESDIVNIYDKDLNRIKSIRLKEIRGHCPIDMTAAADRLYVCTALYDSRAIVYSQNSGSILTEYNTGNNAHSVTVNVQIAVVAVLWSVSWSKRQVAVYSFTDNNCLVVFDVESGVSRIRISDQGRIVTGNEDTGEVKIYDWKQALFDRLSVSLAQLMTLDEIEDLRKYISVSVKDTEVCNVDDEALKSKHVKKHLTILKEKGIFSPDNTNELKALFQTLGHSPTSKLIAPILIYQKYANVYQNDSPLQHQPSVNEGSSNNPFIVSPSHSVPVQSFRNPDHWQNHNLLNVTSTEHGLVCFIRSGKKLGENVLTQLFKLPSAESSDIPQLIYSNVVARQGYKELFLIFLDEIHLVMCYSKTLEIIDINSKEVVKGHQLRAAARSVSVEEGEIFVVVGHLSEILVFNQNLEEVSKFTIKLEEWKYPTDMTVISGRLYIICQVKSGQHSRGHNWPVRAMAFRRGDGEMIARYVIQAEEYKPVSITANKESEFVGVLWSKKVRVRFRQYRSVSKVSLHTLSGDCFFLLDVVDSCRIRLLDKTTMVVIARTDGLKYYNMAHFFTIKALAIRLSHFVSVDECKSLQSFYGVSEEEISRRVSMSSHGRIVTEVVRRLVHLFKILEEKGVISPSNLNALLEPVGRVRSSQLWSPVEAYFKLSGVIPPQLLTSEPQQHHQQLQQHMQQHSTALQQQNVAQQQHALTLEQQAQQRAGFMNQQTTFFQQQQQQQNQLLAQQQQWQQPSLSTGLQHQQPLSYSQPPGFDNRNAPYAQTPLFTQQTFSNRAAFYQQEQEVLYNQQQQAAMYSHPQQGFYNSPLYSQQPHSSASLYQQQQQQVNYPFQQQQWQQHPFNQPHTSLQGQATTSYSDQLEYQPFGEQSGARQEVTPHTAGQHHQQQGGAGSAQVTEGSPMTVDSSPEREITKDDFENLSGINLSTCMEAKSHLIDDQLTDIEYDKLAELHIDKKSLFIVCLKKKIKSWLKSKTFMPWEKSGRWNSTNLFVGCGLTLTNTKEQKNVDDPCKLMYTEILSHDKLKLERRILIAGGPGTGKTMLSIQLACDWSEGKIKDVDILIFVPLMFVGGKQLVQAIKELYIPANMPISEQDIEGILASDSEVMCLIFDGLEQYCPGSGQMSRKSSEVMKVVNKKIHPTCKVVVTTRSGFTEDLQECPLLKIEGFSELERKSYIEKLFPGDIKKQMKLQEIIEDDSFLLDLCDVPLLFTLIIHSIERMTITEDIQCDKVAPFVEKTVESLCFSTTVEHESWPKNEELTLGELAFSGLCKGQQQLSWKKEVLEIKLSNLNHWIESRILVVERDISEKGKDDQKIGEENEEMGQMMEVKGNDTEEKANETTTKTSHMLVQSKVDQCVESEEKSNQGTFSVRFLHKVIQEWFAAIYFCSMMKLFTDEDQFHEYVTSQLRHISPIDLHYLLRFTCYLHPPSTHAIMNYLLTSYCSKDGDIESYIMDCICLCFTEHNDIRSSYMKSSVEEVCKEVITFDSQDGRLLQQAKSLLLQYASDCGIIIKELQLNNSIAAVGETSMTLNSGAKLGLLNTVEVIEVSQWDKLLHQDDFANILKLLIKGKCIKNILCFCSSHPPKHLDAVTMETVFHKNVEVEWNNGYVIWTLDARKGTFQPVYGQMTKAGDIELKEKGMMLYDDFLKSQPDTSTSAFEKLPMKKYLKKMQFFDLEAESAAKQLKMNWDLKPGAKLFKKEEIFDIPMDSSMVRDDEKPSGSGTELVVKEETLAEDAESKLIKEEVIDSDVEEMVDESESLGGDSKEDIKVGEGMMSYEDFLMSQPGTSTSSLEKLPMKQHLKKMQFFDLEAESAAKQLKMDWDLKSGAKWFKKEIIDVPKDSSMKKPSVSGTELGVKGKTLAEDAESKLIKEEIIDSDVEEMVDESESFGGDIKEDIKVGDMISYEDFIMSLPGTSTSAFETMPMKRHFNEMQSDSEAETAAKRLKLTQEKAKITEIPQVPQGDSDFLQFLQAEASIDKSGGILEIPNTGVFLVVPSNALPDIEEQCRIQMKIIPTGMNEEREESCPSNFSVVVELLPDNLTFKCPVMLSLPHCLVLHERVERKARIFISHHGKGCQPKWEEQTHLSYHLQDTSCNILLDSFCMVTFAVNGEIVKAKKLVVYAAAKKPQKESAVVEAGYYPDLPGGGSKFLQSNPELIVAHRKSFFFLKKGDPYRLQFSLEVFTKGWECSNRNKVIPLNTIFASVSSREDSISYLLHRKESTDPSPLCILTVSQEGGLLPVHLAVYPQAPLKDSIPTKVPQHHKSMQDTGSIGWKGGKLVIDDATNIQNVSTSVVLEIPEGALPRDKEPCLICMRILPSRIIQDEVTSFASSSSVAIGLYPHGLQFLKEVTLRLPHCLELQETTGDSVKIFTCNYGEEGGAEWQTEDLPYSLEDSECVISIRELCSVKYLVNDNIVIGKKIALYTAAREDIQNNGASEVEVGYYPDMPGAGELLQMNPNLVRDYKKILHYKAKETSPLKVSLETIVPPVWTRMFPLVDLQEIPFQMIASSIEHSCLYLLTSDKKATELTCKFVATQEEGDVPVEVLLQTCLKGTHASQSVASLSSPGGDSQPMMKSHDDAIKLTICYLSRNLGPEWKSVGRKLGLEEADLYKAEQDNSGIQEIIHGMLVCWKQKKGSQATYANLIKSLERAGRKDLAEKVQNREDLLE